MAHEFRSRYSRTDDSSEQPHGAAAPRRRGRAGGASIHDGPERSLPPITLTPIAIVRNGRVSTADAGWGDLESAIEMLPGFAEGLRGLEAFSHALILFYMEHDPDGET